MSIDDASMPPDPYLRIALVEAIRRIRLKVQWRSGKDIQHLTKRIRLGHLASGTTIAQYESIITSIINDNRAKVYVFQYSDTIYPTLVSVIQDQVWLVIIALDGTMETAFPPSDPDTYLSDPAYRYVAVLGELMP